MKQAEKWFKLELCTFITCKIETEKLAKIAGRTSIYFLTINSQTVRATIQSYVRFGIFCSQEAHRCPTLSSKVTTIFVGNQTVQAYVQHSIAHDVATD